MSKGLDSADVRRRAAAVGVTLDEIRIESVVKLASPVHEALPVAIAENAFEDEPSGFAVALAAGAAR